jgi:hypothetical protein
LQLKKSACASPTGMFRAESKIIKLQAKGNEIVESEIFYSLAGKF